MASIEASYIRRMIKYNSSVWTAVFNNSIVSAGNSCRCQQTILCLVVLASYYGNGNGMDSADGDGTME